MKNDTSKMRALRLAAAICVCAVLLTSFSGCALDLSTKEEDTSSESGAVSGSEDGEKVSVPNVEKLSFETAITIVTDAGLTYSVVEEESEEAKGTVIMQYPPRDEKVDRGSSVTLVIAKPIEQASSSAAESSSGAKEDMVYIGNYVRGWKIKDAEAFLKSQNIGVIVNYEQDTQQSDAGTIIGQSVPEGTYLHRGDTIAFTVSNGPAVQQSVPSQPASPSLSSVALFSGVSASSTLPTEKGYTYMATNILRDDGTCWSEGVKGVGKGEYVMFTNASAVSVSGCGIKNGYTIDFDRFTKNGRLSSVTFRGDNPDDSFTFNLDTKSMTEQKFAFPRTIRTKSLKIIINDAVSGTVYDDTCISLIIPYQ